MLARFRLARLIPIGTLAVAAAGCAAIAPGGRSPLPTSTAGESSAIPVRPAVTPTALATRTPTATPAPTRTPTPTPPPADRLVAAARAVHNGDYAAAVAEYQAILSDGGEADERQAAQLGLGQAALRQGDWVSAENALTRFVQDNPGHPRLADAWFLLGDTRYASGNPTGAVEAYRQYLDLAGGAIESYVQERIGDALNQAGDRGPAILAYRRAITTAPNTSIAAGQREKLALVYRLGGDDQDAVAQYRAILSFARIDSYRARVMLLLGQTLIDAGDRSGYDVFLDLVNTYPRSGDAYQALVALVDNGRRVDSFQRGLVDYYARQYEAAAAAFIDSIDATAAHADAHYYLAMSYRAAGNTAAAIRQFDTLIEDHPRGAFWSQAWIDKAVAQSQAGDLDAAVETLTTFAQDNPRDALAPSALLQAGLLLERAGDYARAALMYRSMQRDYPADESAPDALFAAGLNAYRDDDAALAVDSWRVLSDTYPLAEDYPAALLWLGKLEDSRDRQQARALLDLGAQADPDSYYGIRAAELRDGRPTLQPAPFRLNLERDSDRAAAEAWLARWTGRDDASGIGGLPAAVEADGRFIRGVALWRLGWWDAALSEFNNLRAAYADDPIALYALALAWRDLGVYRPSLMAAARLVALSPAKTASRAPAFIARLVYPVYYADLIVPEAEARGLDPLLMFALTRQESLFEGEATSSAFANGLMQIIPSTGREIAQALAWPGYTTSDLYKPYVNVRFGAYYLARQRDFLDGDLYAALAAYNGGPGNALRWHRIAAGDPDLFLETITLNETRTYLIRIREHLAMYQKLYGQP